MSASPGRVRMVSGASAAQVPIAKPPAPLPELPPPPQSSPVFEWNWWTREARNGWAGSLLLHLLFLTILACWYFVPVERRPVVFDSRLAGSLHGVPEGEMLTGGLNTPLPMPTAPLAQAEAGLESPALSQLELTSLEPELHFQANTKPSAGGGELNANPVQGTATASGWPGSAKGAS